MMVLDQVQRSDTKLRWIGLGVLAGMAILLLGLWYVQVVTRHKYEDSLRVQSFRNVRLAAPRGRIMDRYEQTLADNNPRYVVNLYLEELRDRFLYEYTNSVKKDFITKTGKSPKASERQVLQELARYRAVSNIVWQVSSTILPQPLILNPAAFARHYETRRAIPMPVITDISPEQIALFVEKVGNLKGVELEIETVRTYPHGVLAAHAIGYVQREREETQSDEDDFMFRYRMPDFTGVSGVESGFDTELRGKAGAKAIQVNNIGYRYKDEIWLPPEAGHSVRMTIDLEIQKAAEKALLAGGKDTRGAAVVLDPKTGDVLAIASAPSYNLNMFVQGKDFTEEDWKRMQDEKLLVQYNRALQGMYQPGSIFKIVVALAAFEAGVMTPDEKVYNQGWYQLGRRKIRDDNAPAGESYAFKDAFKYSANTYFIEAGLRAGAERIIEMGHRFGLGEHTGVVPTRFEKPGLFPPEGTLIKSDGSKWDRNDTANLCIGQGELAVTPLQMALMTAAVANGGKLMKGRLIADLIHQESGEVIERFPTGVIDRSIVAKTSHLEWVRKAMLADVEEPHGTGKAAYVEGMRICGKTGTAQVKKPRGMDYITWFVSFAPYENPKYVVVVMLETEFGSGGALCAPKARDIYRAIQKLEQQRAKQAAERSVAVN